MTNKSAELETLLKDKFGLTVVRWNGQESFDANDMRTIHSDGKEVVSNKGTFEVWNFEDESQERYKLVEYDGNFPEDDELVTFMKDAEYDTVQSYELVEPKTATAGHCLYKLAPFMANGISDWDA